MLNSNRGKRCGKIRGRIKKAKPKNVTYSTKYTFDKEIVKDLRLKTISFEKRLRFTALSRKKIKFFYWTFFYKQYLIYKAFKN